jgi:uncharacterized membrane protein YfcA
LNIAEIVELVLIGLFAGVIGGMLGVGGSIVMIPAMTEVLGPNQHLYQAAAMIVNFFVVVPAVYQHRRAKAINGATVIRIIPLSLLAVLGGVGISELPFFSGSGEAYLRGLFGLFLLFVAVSDLYRLARRRHNRLDAPTADTDALSAPRPISWTAAAFVAVPTGLVAGLLGVGGGIMAVPLQRRFLNIPIHQAIANSATIIVATSLVGATAKNFAYVVDHGHSTASFLLAALLIPTAMIGSSFGSRLTHRLKLTVVKVAFFLLLVVAAFRLTHGAVRAVRDAATPSLQAPSEAASARTGSRISGMAHASTSEMRPRRPMHKTPIAAKPATLGAQPAPASSARLETQSEPPLAAQLLDKPAPIPN